MTARAAFVAASCLAFALAPRVARADDADRPEVRLAGAVGAFGRHFAYRDDVRDSLRPYTLAAAPAVSGEIEWYPAARFTTAPEAAFGLAASGEKPFATGSRRGGSDAELPTQAGAYALGLRLRLRFGRHDATLLVDRFSQSMRVSDAPGAPADLPEVAYVGARLGVRGRVLLPAALSVEPTLAFLDVRASGDLASAAWFPRATTLGFEAGLRVGLREGGGLEPFVGVTWRRFLSKLSPEPADVHVAGGAADDFWLASLGVAWHGPAVSR